MSVLSVMYVGFVYYVGLYVYVGLYAPVCVEGLQQLYRRGFCILCGFYKYVSVLYVGILY
jgi:hypothetical protein